jgi:DNA-binding FadR family transcriptional regulator
VGASRPRVTEHLARLERDGLVIRQGRQLVVCADELESSMNKRIPDLPIKVRKSAFLAKEGTGESGARASFEKTS